MRFRHHIFVCTNERPAGGKPACGGRGGDALADEFERAVARHPTLCRAVAVTRCGCLGPCFDGPNLVIYPEGIWYAGVESADVADIVEQHLLGGRVLTRLRYLWPED
ncbi:(2Fe-2S) ferredoxin domain-containing protein [Haliangium ochraceum]|uniref:Putative ferredoxin n=1 Tax=Haliangium ochraceum (strain DSM 14365 / JCM 11303 / SMP-2) TaxID=502025 RepID=D0LXB4_HALO1|nr:(2Fe-2S) ferredoxin domain-containing protein [Haliangium ochraceum]ACY16156.1 putative ferredoxin [Haliangium ochraceum DSM 14365]